MWIVLTQTELDSPFPAGPFNEEDLLRQPYQRTTAQALGKKGLKDGLSNAETISIGGGKVAIKIDVRILLERGDLNVDPTQDKKIQFCG